MPRSSSRRDNDPPDQEQGRNAKAVEPMNGKEHPEGPEAINTASLNGAVNARTNGSASSRSKRKSAMDSFILSEDDTNYDSGINVSGKGDLDISAVDDLDQVERFDLGDTRHSRGGRGEGSIV